MLTTERLKKKYISGGPQTLHELDLHIPKGQIVCLVGESGSGKSTLLRLLAGHLQPCGGRIWVDGKRLAGPEDKLVAGHRHVRLLAQTFDLEGNLSVYENVRRQLLPYTRDYQLFRSEQLLDLAHLMPLRNKKALELSGGEKQRLALCMALADEPQLLLMDEPFSQLNVALKFELRTYLRRILREQGTTALIVTHDTYDALALADRVLVMREGRIVQDASPEDFYLRPVNAYAASFFPYPNLHGGKLLRPEHLLAYAQPEDMPDMDLQLPARWQQSIYMGSGYYHFWQDQQERAWVSLSEQPIPAEQVYLQARQEHLQALEQE